MKLTREYGERKCEGCSSHVPVITVRWGHEDDERVELCEVCLGDLRGLIELMQENKYIQEVMA